MVWHLLVVCLKGRGGLPQLYLPLLSVSFLKVHYHHQRRAVGVNLAPGWGASGRTQWSSCVDHSRRGDALLWRGLLSHRGQTAFTTRTQGHKEKKCILKGSILSTHPLGVCLWVFERIFVARGKVEKKTRRERVGGYFCGQGYYSLTDVVIRPITPCFPGARILALDEKRNFYALFYALIVRVATVLGLVMMNFLSPVSAGSSFGPHR